MSQSEEWFKSIRRGETPKPSTNPPTKAQAFNAMLRALGTDDYPSAFRVYQEAQRREEQGDD